MKGGQHIQYKRLRRRMKRTLYYGRNDNMDQLTLPLTKFAEYYFEKNAPFDYLDMDFATNLSREGCVNPCSLIVAMVYLDRFRSCNQKQFEASDPSDLYMAALLLASKYLNDDGESDYVYNDEWAASAKKPLTHLNQMEMQILSGIDDPLGLIEKAVCQQEVSKRCWQKNHGCSTSMSNYYNCCSYTELGLLSSELANAEFLWTSFLQPFLATIGFASLLYATSVFALWTTANGFIEPSTCPKQSSMEVFWWTIPPIESNNDLFRDHS